MRAVCCLGGHALSETDQQPCQPRHYPHHHPSVHPAPHHPLPPQLADHQEYRRRRQDPLDRSRLQSHPLLASKPCNIFLAHDDHLSVYR